MKEAWKKRKLRDVCELINGRAYSKPELLADGKYPVLRVGNFFTNNNWYYSDLELSPEKYCDNGDLLYAWSASFGPRIWEGGKAIFHYHIWRVQPVSTLIDKKFLFFWFLWDADEIKKDQGAGTTMIHVSKGSMEDRDILLPQLPEQQRIVALLDEAFASLATAKANAERNLKNAHAVYEGHLQAFFCERREGWIEMPLADLCIVDWGNTNLTKRAYVQGGQFLAVSAAGCDGRIGHKEHDKYTPVLSAIGAKCGRMFLPEEDFTAIKNTITLTPKNGMCTGSFLYRLLTHVELPKRGSAQPFISKGDIQEFRVSVPRDSVVQQEIESSLACVEVETQRLTSLYERKLAALDELKKSLLQQAFSGEL